MTDTSIQITVDMIRLREICQAVQRDTEQGLRPGIHQTEQKIHQGISFGRRSPSGEAEAAAQALAYALNRYARNSVSHLQRAEQLANFLDRVLTEYGDAEAILALNFETLLDKLDNAMPASTKPQPATGAQP